MSNIKQFINKNRNNPTRAEKILQWHLEKFKTEIIFQYQIGKCIVDFYLPEYNLIIEVDGWYHLNNLKNDHWRDVAANSLKYNLVRIKNSEVVFGNAKKALCKIEGIINKIKTYPQKNFIVSSLCTGKKS